MIRKSEKISSNFTWWGNQNSICACKTTRKSEGVVSLLQLLGNLKTEHSIFTLKWPPNKNLMLKSMKSLRS